MRLRKKKLSPQEINNEAELQAIKAHDNLIALGYAEEIEPLRLPNKRGRIGIVLASLASILYGISGFIFGMGVGVSVPAGSFFFHFLDQLTIISIVLGVLAVCSAALGMLKKHGSRVTPVVAFVILLTAPLVFHILGVTFGMMMP